jgi:hypothetical protein
MYLREADWDTSPDGLGGLKDGLLTQEDEVLCDKCDKRDMRAFGVTRGNPLDHAEVVTAVSNEFIFEGVHGFRYSCGVSF